ncbi:alpha/beta fold hydrolase [Planomonospora parontospora]|uniref:alpha/beta fold hydrolase n=1 Tax=Planomonospora parontospora TaxID=58119 RepID=UPI00167170F6|nr:alpha/beta fold hydrolase [Planomonospora parontospora]GGL54402.1 alpha/beta hydrolase [Planomonospora parontospora subsp. antibiotica]GII13762.1 alpha/beta hydrolase [Planomonospora parontospora subsp. antibiotica]
MGIFVQKSGRADAPAVVLLHGAGTSGWMWTRQVADLAADFLVLVPDLPGHGRSNALPWVSIADTAALVAEMITSHAPGRRAHVVGLSLGGYVGLHLAAAHPEPVATLTVSGVNILPFPNRGTMRIMGALMTPLMKWGPMLRANARSLNIPAEDFDGYREAARAMTRQAFRRVSEEALDFRVPVGAGDSPCPVLAVAGGNEHDLIKRSLPGIAAAFPAGETRLVPGAGHGWNGEKPELFTAMVRARATGGPLPGELLAV